MLSYIISMAIFFGIPILLAFLIPSAIALGWVKRLFIFAVMAFALLPFGGGGDGAEGSLYRQVVWGGLFAYATFTLVRNEDGRFTFPRGYLPVWLLLLLAYMFLTITWSPIPVVSLKRAVQVLGAVIIAMAIAKSSEGRTLQERLIIPSVFFLALGALTYVASPGFAIDHLGGFKGFTTHKNLWGQFSVLAALSSLYLIFTKQDYKLGWLLFVAFSFSTVVSKSSTSILLLATAISITWIWWSITRGKTLARGILLLTVVTLASSLHVYVIMNGHLPTDALINVVLDALGKSITLTGRTYLWELMYQEIARHPLFGIGYGGFWLNYEGPSTWVILRLNWGPPTQAHNGYIDIVNEMGYFGLALVILTLIAHARNLIALYKMGYRRDAMYHICLLVSVITMNISEATLLRSTHIWWIITATSMVMVYRQTNHNIKTATIGRNGVSPEIIHA